MRISQAGERTYEHQAAAVLNQAAPIQNQWYTVLDTVNFAKLVQAACQVTATNETLEYRITIDGIAYVVSIVATAATLYRIAILVTATAIVLSVGTTNYPYYRAFLKECRSLTIEMRKTTAAGAGNLQSVVEYELLRF